MRIRVVHTTCNFSTCLQTNVFPFMLTFPISQYRSKKVHLLNHLIFGSTLATVPGATVDWYCNGLMTFPRLLLTTGEWCYDKTLLVICWANNTFDAYNKVGYHLCFCLYIFRRLIVARSLVLFPPAPFTRSVEQQQQLSCTENNSLSSTMSSTF